MPKSVLLSTRVGIERRPWLSGLSWFVVTNWNASVNVRTHIESEQVAWNCLQELHIQRQKFDPIYMRGLTRAPQRRSLSTIGAQASLCPN